MLPFVSIIMSIYNEPVSWLKQSIESVLTQTYKNFEFIIINDNPGRIENKDMLSLYCSEDERIIPVFNDTNLGLVKSLNKGLRIAKGKYIARMDADDISLSHRIEKQVYYLENNENVDVLNTSIMKFFNDDKSNTQLFSCPCEHEEISERLLFSNILFHPSVMLRNSTLKRYAIQYNEKYLYAQDYALWLKLLSEGAIFHSLSEPLLLYRSSDTQISRAKLNAQNFYKNLIQKDFFYDYLSRYKFDTVDLKSFKEVLKLGQVAVNYHYTIIEKTMIYRLLLSCRKDIYKLLAVVLIPSKFCLSKKQSVKIFLSNFSNKWLSETIDV